MNNIYDQVILFERTNPKLSYCSPMKNGTSLLRGTAAMQLLLGVPVLFDSKAKASYLKYLLYDDQWKSLLSPGEDMVMGILKSDYDNLDKQKMLEFLYSEDLSENIKAISIAYNQDYSPKASHLLKQLQSRDRINTLCNMRIPDSIQKLNFHISAVEEHGMQLFCFHDIGIFISLGYDYSFEAKDSYSSDDYISAFKAAGDMSRFQILKALINKPCTPVQLSQEIGVTLSTINHHLKTLVSCGLISIVFSTQGYKGTVYEINKAKVENMIGGICDALS